MGTIWPKKNIIYVIQYIIVYEDIDDAKETHTHTHTHTNNDATGGHCAVVHAKGEGQPTSSRSRSLKGTALDSLNMVLSSLKTAPWSTSVSASSATALPLLVLDITAASLLWIYEAPR